MPYFEVQLTNKLQRLYQVGPDTIIGRAPQCHIQLLSRAVSRRHARIEFDGSQAIISDLGTKNGIKLNGERIQGAAVVSEGDTVVVGDIKMRYRAHDRARPPRDAIDLRGRQAGPADLQAALAPSAGFIVQAHPHALTQFQATVGRGRISHLSELDEAARFRLQIALKEALENARVHGCGGDPDRSITVSFSEDDDEFLMTVQDGGAGFDVQKTLAGCEEVAHPERAVRERHTLGPNAGLRIILGCVDRIQFGEGGAAIHMGKFKAGGEMIVISEDGLVSDPLEEPSDDDTEELQLPGLDPGSEITLDDLM